MTKATVIRKAKAGCNGGWYLRTVDNGRINDTTLSLDDGASPAEALARAGLLAEGVDIGVSEDVETIE